MAQSPELLLDPTQLLFCCCSQWLNNTAVVVAPRCGIFGAVGPQNKPTSWVLAGSAAVCCKPSGGSWWLVGFLSGTSSYSTVVNTFTWNLPGQATQLGSTGVTLANCAQLCISSANCYAW